MAARNPKLEPKKFKSHNKTWHRESRHSIHRIVMVFLTTILVDTRHTDGQPAASSSLAHLNVGSRSNFPLLHCRYAQLVKSGCHVLEVGYDVWAGLNLAQARGESTVGEWLVRFHPKTLIRLNPQALIRLNSKTPIRPNSKTLIRLNSKTLIRLNPKP